MLVSWLLINGCYSEWAEVISGIPQGTILGDDLTLTGHANFNKITMPYCTLNYCLHNEPPHYPRKCRSTTNQYFIYTHTINIKT